MFEDLIYDKKKKCYDDPVDYGETGVAGTLTPVSDQYQDEPEPDEVTYYGY